MKKWIWFSIFLVLLMIPLSACSGSTSQTKPAPPLPAAQPASSTQPASQGLSLKINEPDDESVVKTSSVNLSGSVSANAEITVNGTSVAVENGNFTAMVELEEGPNSLEIRATDGKGHEETRVLTIVYLP